MKVIYTHREMICEDHPDFPRVAEETGFPIREATRLDYARRLLIGSRAKFNAERKYGPYLYQQARCALHLAIRRQLSSYDKEAVQACRSVLSERRWHAARSHA